MKIRFARHTNNLNALVAFYVNVLGLEILGEFKNHSGYDGFFLGFKDKDWHLEFTQTGETVSHTFDPDDILVFYPGTEKEYDRILLKIKDQGIDRTIAKNPYWQRNGVSIADPDGYPVVISPLKIVTPG